MSSKNILQRLGERKIIDMVRERARNADIDKPGSYPGDDVCVINIGSEKLAITTDTVWEKTHFPIGVRAWFAGWYLAAVNLSDLASIAAKPIGLLLNISAPNDTKTRWMEDFADGLCACLQRYDALLLGGDTKEGPGVFSATAIGTCPGGMCTPRSGVKPGDLIGITGNVGLRAALLKKGRGEESLHINPRIFEALAGARAGVRAATDTSDSLAIALHSLSETSKVKIELMKDTIPLDPLLTEVPDLMEKAWGLGGDFELAIAFPPERQENVEEAISLSGTKLTIIGKACTGKGVNITDGKSSIPLPRVGYEHFKGGHYGDEK